MSVREYQEGFVSPAEALERLSAAGVVKEGLKNGDQLIRRLLATGKIDGIAPPERRPQLGWEVNLASLNDYIEMETMGPEELRKRLRALKSIEQELAETKQQLEETAKALKSAERKLSKLEPAPAKQKPARSRRKNKPAAPAAVEQPADEPAVTVTEEDPNQDTE